MLSSFHISTVTINKEFGNCMENLMPLLFV